MSSDGAAPSDGDAVRGEVASLVFLDLEATGLEAARITEMCLVAVGAAELLRAAPSAPRVKHKLCVCLNPLGPLDPLASRLTRLDNWMLEAELPFDRGLMSLLEAFLARLRPPICLLAHNGARFDFPLLAKQAAALKIDFPAGLQCVDTLLAFRHIFGPQIAAPVCRKLDFSQTQTQKTEVVVKGSFEDDFWDAAMAAEADAVEAAIANERTPKRPTLPSQGRRREFSLGALMEAELGAAWRPPGALHSAEADTETLLALAASTAPSFLAYVNQNAAPFPLK